MTAQVQTLSLLEVAQRCAPSQPLEETLRDQVRFLALVFTYGEIEDIVAIRQHYDNATLTHALINAPPGIIDARSWAYWNLILRDLSPPPPMPTRTFA